MPEKFGFRILHLHTLDCNGFAEEGQRPFHILLDVEGNSLSDSAMTLAADGIFLVY